MCFLCHVSFPTFIKYLTAGQYFDYDTILLHLGDVLCFDEGYTEEAQEVICLEYEESLYHFKHKMHFAPKSLSPTSPNYNSAPITDITKSCFSYAP